MAVNIRLWPSHRTAAGFAEIDEHERALRTVLEILEPESSDHGYEVRRLVSRGVRTLAAEPSPLAQADDAKRRRDLGGEVGVLMAGDAALRRQPWMPIQPGDVVLLWLPGAIHGAEDFGQTFVGSGDDTDRDYGAMLVEVSRTADAGVQDWPTTVMELWMEAGPAALTVIRAGAVVHGNPARGGA